MYKFKPFLKTVIWGGNKIAALKNIPGAPKNVGESWEISDLPGFESVVADGPEKGLSIKDLIHRHGESLIGKKAISRFGDTFPLLVKFIDAKDDLSVQVHPDDELAKKRHNALGKSEMWYIIDTAPGALIYSGFKHHVTPDQYQQLVASKHIMDIITPHKSAPGDVYFLPAGRIHSIGAGNFLAEIQITSDITYRIYDFDRRDANGNPRPLHTDLAKDAIDYSVNDDYRTICNFNPSGYTPIINCDKFNVSHLSVKNTMTTPPADDSFTILICLKGNCTVDDGSHTATLNPCETILIPASTPQVTIKSDSAELLSASL